MKGLPHRYPRYGTVGLVILLVMETAVGRLALITDQMTYHHIAQGRARNKDWMATF